MNGLLIVLGLVCAGLAGAVVWLLLDRGRRQAEVARAVERAERAERDLAGAWTTIAAREAKIEDLTRKSGALEVRMAGLEGDLEEASKLHAAEMRRAQEVTAEQVKSVEQREREFRQAIEKRDEQMRESFRALSAESLSKSAQDFLKLAGERMAAQQQLGASEMDKRRVAVEQLVKPIEETLKRTGEHLAAIEKERTAAYSGLVEQVRAVAEGNKHLRDETGKLVRALREPQVRGRYGEIQLKKVAELAGMRAYCDFVEQETTRDESGAALRPDMIVKLPNGREVAVDAKANLKPYLDALEATEPERVEAALQAFADGIASQAAQLAKKGYWKQYDGSPEFVVMFVPGDQFVDAALAKRPDLLEFAANLRVLLASPSSLIAMLRAVHVGYQEHRLAEDALILRDLGRELHERMTTAMGYVSKLGGALNTAVERYNDFAGSYEKRLEPTLKKFEEAGVKSGKELPEVEQVVVRARGVAGPTPLFESAAEKD